MKAHIFIVLLILLIVHLRTLDSKATSSTSSMKKTSSKLKKLDKKRKSTRNVILPKRKGKRAKPAISLSSLLDDITHTLQSTAETAKSTTSRLQRSVKSMISSDFEALLLRMTTPDDSRPDDNDVDRFMATIETFARDMDFKSETNPYRVTLRKLWHKMQETDGRTILKSFFLLHTLLRYSQPEDALIFKTLLTKMMKERCKKTKVKYFDLGKIKRFSAETAHLSDFTQRYGAFVIKRAKTFTSSWEEMKLIAHGMRTDDVCAQMLKAYKVLDAALNCRISAEEECEAIVSCLERTAVDTGDLFKLYYEKLIFILRENEVGDIFAGWKQAEVKTVLTHLITFYNERFDIISSFLAEVQSMLQLYNIKIPSSLEGLPSFIKPPFLSSSKRVSTTHSKRTYAEESSAHKPAFDTDSFDADAAVEKAVKSSRSDMGQTATDDGSFSAYRSTSKGKNKSFSEEVEGIFKDEH